MIPALILCYGIPGSGKTTWAKRMVQKYPNKVHRVNRDDLRTMLLGGYQKMFDKKLERVVTLMEELVIEEMGVRGRSLIIDDTNLNPRTVISFTSTSEYNSIFWKTFSIDSNIAITRDAKRDRTVGEDVIRQMQTKFNINTRPFFPEFEEDYFESK